MSPLLWEEETLMARQAARRRNPIVPRARRLDDLDPFILAPGEPARQGRPDPHARQGSPRTYLGRAARTPWSYVTRNVLTFWRDTCSTCLCASSARAHTL